MGRIIGGRYEVSGVLGQGAQGGVLLARDRIGERMVAVKTHRTPDARSRRRAQREAQMLRTVRPHPGLPVVRDLVEEPTAVHVVMDHVEGRSLQQLLDHEGDPGLPAADVLAWLTAAAEPLEHLHGHDPAIVHGDVKPANLLLTSDGRVVLVDFGSASTTSFEPPYAGGFAAPETHAGRATTPATDVFGLAATAFALLTGSPPGPGSDPPTGPLQALRAGLALDPADRPASPSALIDALAGAVQPGRRDDPRTRLIGRSDDLEAVTRELSARRLVTVCGPGGVGKTRLAGEVAARASETYPHGVWTVDLAPVTDPARLAERVADAIGIVERPGVQPLDAVVGVLRSGPCLLVLDNCEHLLGEIAAIVADLVDRCAALHVLATSREPLAVSVERVWPLQPLSVPDAGEPVDRDLLSRHGAVRLFVQRARAADPRFRLDDDTSAVVSEVCRRLDGLPLAVELAASHAAGMHVGEILSAIDARMTSLSPAATTAARHATLGAALDASYALLSSVEQAVLRRLGVASGSFDLDAAAALCPDVAEPAVAGETVERLAYRNVLAAAGEGRYRMLETVRAYALDRLASHGEADAARSRHLAHYLALAERAAGGLHGPDEPVWLRRLDDDHDNLRAAITWGLDHDPARACRLVAAMRAYWWVRCHAQEAGRFAEAALACAPDEAARCAILLVAGEAADMRSDLEAARSAYTSAEQSAGDDLRLRTLAHLGLARCAARSGELDASREQCDRAVELAQRYGEPWMLGEALHSLGYLESGRGNPVAARGWLERSLQAHRRAGNPSGIANSLSFLGEALRHTGDYEEAGRCAAEGAQLAGLVGARWQAIVCREVSGLIRLDQGDLRRGLEILQGVVADARKVGVRSDTCYTLTSIGAVCVELGELDAALAYHREALELLRDDDSATGMCFVLGNLAETHVYRGELDEAERVLTQAMALTADSATVPTGWVWEVAGRLARARSQPAEAVELYAKSLRVAVALCQRVDALRPGVGAAAALAEAGRHSEAMRLLAATHAHARASGTMVLPTDVELSEQTQTLARAALGPEAFDEAWAAGAAMTLAEATEAILG